MFHKFMLAFLVAVVIAIVTPVALAAERPQPHLFLPITAHVAEDMLGGAVGLGWQEPRTGFLLALQVTYDRIDGVDGTVTPVRPHVDTFTNWPPPQPVAYSTESRGSTGIAFTFAVPLWKPSTSKARK